MNNEHYGMIVGCIADVCKNPLNVRYVEANKWKGQSGQYKGFAMFNSVEDGLRAAMKILLVYMGKYRLVTVAQIINRWAPPSENNTKQYVWNVCKASSLYASDAIATKQEFINLVVSMAFIESQFNDVALVERVLERLGREGMTGWGKVALDSLT